METHKKREKDTYKKIISFIILFRYVYSHSVSVIKSEIITV